MGTNLLLTIYLASNMDSVVVAITTPRSATMHRDLHPITVLKIKTKLASLKETDLEVNCYFKTAELRRFIIPKVRVF